MNGDLSVGSINGSGFSPTNLVINPEFTINQRGAATRTTTSSAYNFDRWYYDGTNLLQGVENNNLRATTYVISWEGSSTCAYSLNTAAASGQGSESYTSVTNGGTITIASVGSNNLWLKFTSDLGNLNKVMLVQGTETSVFVARQYGTELALCQRYLPAVSAVSGTNRPLPGIATALTTNVNLIFNHPVPARVPGTGVAVSNSGHFQFSNNDGNTSSTAVSFGAGGTNATQVVITVAVSRGATTTPGWIYFNNASGILYITGCEL